MEKQVKFLLWLAVVLSVIWLTTSPDFEPLIVLITSLVAAVAAHVKDLQNHSALIKDDRDINQDLEVVNEPPKDEILVNPVISLAQRLIHVYEGHGIHINEIPRVTPEQFGITLSTISEQSRFIEKITPEYIKWVSGTFGINRSWLETEVGGIYTTKNYYKNEFELLRLLKELKAEYGNELDVYAFKNVSSLDSKQDVEQFVNLLISVPLFKIDGRIICKFIPTKTMWEWGYQKSRYQLKGIIRVAYRTLKIDFIGYDVNKDEMRSLAFGKVIPQSVLSKMFSYTWNPDDYTDSARESGCAKETDELDAIIEYVKERGYVNTLKSGA